MSDINFYFVTPT